MAKHKHDIFKKSYPEFVVDTTDSEIIFLDGTKMLVNVTESGELIALDQIERRSYKEKLNNPVLLDQISIPYILGNEVKKTYPRLIGYQMF